MTLACDVAPTQGFVLTKDQFTGNRLLGDGSRHIMLYGGSRSGKTFLLVRAVILRALKAPGSRHAIFRFRFNHIKISIGMDTFPKVISLCFPGLPYRIDKTDWCIRLPNGSEIWLAGLDDKQRTEKILGQEYATIYHNECSQISYDSVLMARTRLAQKTLLQTREYFDCNPPGKGHWTAKIFVDGLDPASGSSRREIADRELYGAMLMNPHGNMDNLDDNYIRMLENMPEKKRLRFLLGQFTSEYDNALWTYEQIDNARVTSQQIGNIDMQRVVVAVDPSGASGNEDLRSDEIGIVVVGLGVDGVAYILADYTLRDSPEEWGKKAVWAYHEHQADLVVVEKNFGGDMAAYVIRSRDGRIPIALRTTGSRGKVVRAEPVSSLYSQGLVKHVGRFDEMEDQLTEFTSAGYMGSRSPDRADAMIWGVNEVMLPEGHADIQSLRL